MTARLASCLQTIITRTIFLKTGFFHPCLTF
jgi:hypothetical protein